MRLTSDPDSAAQAGVGLSPVAVCDQVPKGVAPPLGAPQHFRQHQVSLTGGCPEPVRAADVAAFTDSGAPATLALPFPGEKPESGRSATAGQAGVGPRHADLCAQVSVGLASRQFAPHIGQGVRAEHRKRWPLLSTSVP